MEEARRDARALEQDGWLVVQTAKWYPDRIARIAMPLDAEDRWMTAFGFERTENDYADQVRSRTWTPQLQFLTDERLFVPMADLKAIDEFLKRGRPQSVAVPIKERSLEIFGDEKRLDELYRGSALFAPGRLRLDQLSCFVVPEPLPWARGADTSKPVLVLENVATWDSYRRWNEQHAFFSGVVYGEELNGQAGEALSLPDLAAQAQRRPAPGPQQLLDQPGVRGDFNLGEGHGGRQKEWNVRDTGL
jgi:hypothetical protein